MMKKILHISQSSGGVRTYIENIIYPIDRDTFEPILVSSDSEFVEDAKANRVTAVNVKMSRTPGLSDILAIWKVVRLINQYEIDLIHSHSAKGGAIGRVAGFLTGRKVVFTPNAFSYLSFTGLKRKTFIFIEKVLKNLTACFLGVSHSEANRAIDEIGFPERKVSCVLNSITPKSVKKEDYLLKGKIGMIGRITYQKRPLDFVKMANLLIQAGHDCKFELLGVGVHDHLLEETQELIKQFGLEDKIELSPWGKYDKVEDFYESLDIYIMTSAFEGLSFALLEAMDFGLPCVVSEADGNRDTVIHGENGYIYNTIEELVEYVKGLLQSDEERIRLGKAGIAHIESQHNTIINIKQIENIYNEQ